MATVTNIRIGTVEAAVRHEMSRPPDLPTIFQMVKESGTFGFLDGAMTTAEINRYLRN